MLRAMKMLVFGVCFLSSCFVSAQVVRESGTSETVKIGADGRLSYGADSKGNRLPDFSHVGYHSGEKAIPDVPVQMTVERTLWLPRVW